MCSPCGPMICYKYEDCGPPLRCLPRSAFKRNGLQDCQFFQQGSIRYLCRECDSCKPVASPCPPCVRRPPPGKTYTGKASTSASRAEEGGAEKKDEKENQLKRTKSRELRGGIMYYSCHCIKRNGLQHDCRRTGCGGEPACLVLPDPLCAPSQLARARGLADPAPLAAHMRAASGGGSGGPADAGSGSGKRFIVCELKGIIPDAGSADKGGKCCCSAPGGGSAAASGGPAAGLPVMARKYGHVLPSNDVMTPFDPLCPIPTGKSALTILENITENIEEIEEEFLVFRDLSSHPNIPEFFGLFLKRGVCSDDDQIWFVMELCTGGSVTDLCAGIRAHGNSLTEPQLAYVLRGTVRALTHLHAHRCMHRDVKGHNILLTENGEVKLVDFGVSSHLAATAARRNTSVGTPYWMAPEVIACEQQLDQSYDCRCDVWSVGITAIELAEGEPPLSGLHPMRALFQIPRNPPPTLAHPELFSSQLADFIAECLVKDMNQRPFARELLEHPLLLAVSSLEEKSHRKARPEKMYTDDLATLEVLTEDAIVEQLQKRYNQNQIYTYIGDILVAVNPFTDIGIYTTKSQQIYQGRCRSDNPPHIYAVADAAHQALMHQKQHQAIVISGESGAGKTESANLLLKQLVFLSKTQSGNVEDKILQVNPIMEAFGNARTGINANSSRFGKYLDLSLMRVGRMSGARISVYLLEQSRVVHQALGESNFHVFYYLYDGLESEGRWRKFYLDEQLKSRHRYLQPLSVAHREHNVHRWRQLNQAFKVVGFQDEEVQIIYKMLSAILHLGDIEFGETAGDDNTDNKATIIDTAPLHRASCLLGVETVDLRECLTSSSVVARGETIARHCSPVEAAVARDATARGLYARAFDRIVERINALLCQNRPYGTEQLSIGILDIFGFENFNRNSFEQLCINIANEQIQYYFNQHIFTWEQQEYMAEGVPVDLVEFSDNRPVLDMLLSRPMGLLALLDEESRFPRSTDRSLIEKFHNNIKSKYYVRPKSDAICFAIHHFAGRVVYQADGFLEKNRNFLPPEVVQLMRQSQYDIIRFLFQCPITKTGNLYSPLQGDMDTRSLDSPISGDTRERFNSRGLASQSRAQQTVSTYFRYSLMELLQKMVSGSPQYSFLAFSYDEEVKPSRDTCRLLLLRLKMDGWALGKSKVFLKYYHVEVLARIYEEQIRKVVLLQACARGWIARRYFLRLKAQMAISVLTLQKHMY
ncbi:hypothetical protein MSG28_010933 [Choristoneura fumiferana]|uniref:Uncharacterized protein n=1 Tax=Choristoneura fumiferana TaxID=7141 RepID=A0ACC0KQ09_CHOFU|nr:hypothetical protein MSG28_010933 [Choristoneura fumiferana]